MIKKIADIILFSNLFVSLCFSALTLQTFYVFEISASPLPICLFVFVATLLTYNFHRWYKNNRLQQIHNEPLRISWHRDHKKQIFFLLLFLLVTLAVIVFYFSLLTINTLLLLTVFGFISGLYTLPLIPFNNKWIRLRDIPYSKVIWVSMVVTGTAVFLPKVQYESNGVLNFNTFLYSISIFFFLAAITIPFNIRDIEVDKAENLKTLPTSWGENRSKIISLILITMYIISITLFYIMARTITAHTLVLLYITGVATIILIINAHKNRSEYYYGYFLESMPLLNCFAIIISN